MYELLAEAVQNHGENAVRNVLAELAAKQDGSRILTIVGNSGMHVIPEALIRGELYTATHGTLDLSKGTSLAEIYIAILRPLADKLREKTWEKIYFIPTGPTTLSLQIKLLVYHITRISTVDLYYERGSYIEVDLDYRSYLFPQKE